MNTLELSRRGVRSTRTNALLLAAVVLILVGVIATFKILRGGRAPLSNAQISAFLRDDADPGGIVYALSQIRLRAQRGERLDAWASDLLRLSSHPAEDVRHNVADLMGLDPSREDFHRTLLEMLRSQTVLVRNSAALSLAAFGDAAGREQIASMLEPSLVDAPRPGYVQTVVKVGAAIAHGDVIVRLQSGGAAFDVLSPVSGRIRSLAVDNGDMVSGGTRLAVVEPGPDEVLAALRALETIGKPQDVTAIMAIANSDAFPEPVRTQAKLTQEKIMQRAQ